MKNETAFRGIKQFINRTYQTATNSTDLTITRKQIIEYIIENDITFSPSTIDNYRRMFSVVNILTSGDGKGSYRILQPIPENLKLRGLRILYKQTLYYERTTK